MKKRLPATAALLTSCVILAMASSPILANCGNCPGDIDQSGIVDLVDTSGFVTALLAEEAACADVNADGMINGHDIESFVSLATSGTGLCADSTATYRLDFDATWNETTHPTDFPSNPHFSAVIGGTHGDMVEFWEVGGLATAGIERMAERGTKGLLRGEIQDEIAAGFAEFVIEGPTVFGSPGSVSVTFQITGAFPLTTAVSMIAPSPDWFVGVNGLPLFDEDGWLDEVTIPLVPYDAGTDSATTYMGADIDTDPADPIQEITGYPLDVDGIVAPLGTFTFTRIDVQ